MDSFKAYLVDSLPRPTQDTARGLLFKGHADNAEAAKRFEHNAGSRARQKLDDCRRNYENGSETELGTRLRRQYANNPTEDNRPMLPRLLQ